MEDIRYSIDMHIAIAWLKTHYTLSAAQHLKERKNQQVIDGRQTQSSNGPPSKKQSQKEDTRVRRHGCPMLTIVATRNSGPKPGYQQQCISICESAPTI
jgi:hypothetical protein